jgi:hypothetical protein
MKVTLGAAFLLLVATHASAAPILGDRAFQLVLDRAPTIAGIQDANVSPAGGSDRESLTTLFLDLSNPGPADIAAALEISHGPSLVGRDMHLASRLQPDQRDVGGPGGNAVIPEPATLLTLAAGLMGFKLARARRVRQT